MVEDCGLLLCVCVILLFCYCTQCVCSVYRYVCVAVVYASALYVCGFVVAHTADVANTCTQYYTHAHPQLPFDNPCTTSHHFPSLPPSLSPFTPPCSTHSHPQLNLAIIEDDVVNSLVATPQFVASFPIAPSTNSATLQYWGDPGNSYTASVAADDPTIVSASLPFPDTGTIRCLWW